MIDRDEMERAADFISENSEADDYTIEISSSQSLYCRFGHNRITQHSDGETVALTYETFYDKQRASVQVNCLDMETLENVIVTAENMALNNPENVEHQPSAGVIDIIRTDNYCEQTAAIDSSQLVDNIGKVINYADSVGGWVSGLSQRHLCQQLLRTKNGFNAYDRQSWFGHSMTIKKDSAETKTATSLKNYDLFSIDRQIDRLKERFSMLAAPPAPMDAGRYSVILTADAFADWLLMLFSYFYNRRSLDEGTSPLSGMLDKDCFGSNFSLKSTMIDSSLSARPFNSDYTANGEVCWVDNGVLKNLPAGRDYAKKMGIEPCTPYNLKMAGGGATLDEMMQKVKRGIIVNRLWYIRLIDGKSGEMTGLTRDGVLYFEDGKIKYPVTNFRWNETFHSACQRILSLGQAEQVAHNLSVAPVLIDDFNFVDSTTF